MNINVSLSPARRQASLKRAENCTGIALHSGEPVTLTMRPAPVDSGIVFRRTDITDRDNRILVRPDTVTKVKNCTTIGNAAGVQVATIEHVMAALAASGVDNLVIDIDGGETPAMDGSSEPFLKMIEKAGLARQNRARRYIEVLKPVYVKDGKSEAWISPAKTLRMDVTIDFDDAAIGRQQIVIEPDVRAFRDRIASARTFARAHEVVALREAGLSLGGSFDNAILVDGDKVLNPDGLRYSDEFVRHKALDLLGDMYVAGPLLADVKTVRGGHGLNHQLLLALFADPKAWRFVHLADLPTTAEPVSALEEVLPAL